MMQLELPTTALMDRCLGGILRARSISTRSTAPTMWRHHTVAAFTVQAETRSTRAPSCWATRRLAVAAYVRGTCLGYSRGADTGNTSDMIYIYIY